MASDYNPFQSPEAISHPRGGAAWPIVPFQSGHQRAMITIWLLAILAIIYVVGIALSCTEYAALDQLPDGTYVFVGAGAEAEQGRRLLAVAEMMIALGTIVAFSMWTHRASRNLPALGGRGLQYTPAWAVGWFFIPFANLVMPYLVAAEIWRESDPEQKHLDAQGGKATSPLVISWWLTYMTRSVPAIVTATIIFLTTIKFGPPHGSSRQLAHELNQWGPSFLLLTLAAESIGVIAASLAIIYVYRASANQQAKFDSIHGDGFSA